MIKREAKRQMLEIFDWFYYEDDIQKMDNDKANYKPEIAKLKRLTSLIKDDEAQEELVERVYNEIMDNLFAIGTKDNQRAYLIDFIADFKRQAVVFSKYGRDPKVDPGNLRPGSRQPGDFYDSDLEHEVNVIIDSMIKGGGDSYFKKLRGLRKSYETYVVCVYFFHFLIGNAILKICNIFGFEYSDLSNAPGGWGTALQQDTEKLELSTKGIVLLYHYWALYDAEKNIKYHKKEAAEKFGRSLKSLEGAINNFDPETAFAGNIHPKTRTEFMYQLRVIMSILGVECKPAHDEALKAYNLLSK